jgi:hypothetical protein
MHSENFQEKFVDNIIKNKINGHHIDKVGNLWLYPATREGMLEIMNNEQFFPGQYKKNVKEESNPLIFYNISLENIEKDDELRRKIINMGASGFALINKRAEKNDKLLKVFCHQPEARINFIKLERVRISTSKSEYEIKTKCFTRMIQCNKCHIIGHEENKCNESSFYCGYCAGEHKSSLCMNAQDKSKYNCRNCNINAVHDSYDRKRCESLKKAETKLQKDELEKLMNNINQNSNSSFTSMSSIVTSRNSYSSRINDCSSTAQIPDLSAQFKEQMNAISSLFANQTSEINRKIKNDIITAKAELSQEFDTKLIDSEVRITNELINLIKANAGNLSSMKKVEKLPIHSNEPFEKYLQKYTNIQDEKDKET